MFSVGRKHLCQWGLHEIINVFMKTHLEIPSAWCGHIAWSFNSRGRRIKPWLANIYRTVWNQYRFGANNIPFEYACSHNGPSDGFALFFSSQMVVIHAITNFLLSGQYSGPYIGCSVTEMERDRGRLTAVINRPITDCQATRSEASDWLTKQQGTPQLNRPKVNYHKQWKKWRFATGNWLELMVCTRTMVTIVHSI